MRPGVKGTVTLWPAFFAACSTPAATGPGTIRSASETFLPPDWLPLSLPPVCWPLNSLWDALKRLQHLCELLRLVDVPILLRVPGGYGRRSLRPALSEPRKVDAEAQAVETN